MNSMERVTATLNHKKPDRTPVYPILSGVTRKLVGASYEKWSTDAETCAEALWKSVEQFGLDAVLTLIDLSVESDAWGQKLIFHENDAAHPDYSQRVIPEIEDYAKIKKADYKSSQRMTMHLDVCRRLVDRANGEVPVIAFVFGPLGILSMLRGQEDLYTDLYDDPDAVKAAAREITETLKDYVNAIIDTGVNAIMFDTLFASGTIMSKEMWRDTEAPLVHELANICHSRGCLVMIHNCGERIYFDAQIEAMDPAAISFLYPPDDCRDFAECKAKYGGKITLIGCVPPPMVVLSDDEEWMRVCREQIAVMGADGGYILATGCEYPSGADFRKAELMVKCARE